jgi:Co/Zn/Cd efflux system component
MMGYAVVAFMVNVYVLVRLARMRDGGVHLDAGYLCTRADVIAKLAVFASGAVVWATHWRYADLLVAVGIAGFVFNEALEILARARTDASSA